MLYALMINKIPDSLRVFPMHQTNMNIETEHVYDSPEN